jgi:hypothetical protein
MPRAKKKPHVDSACDDDGMFGISGMEPLKPCCPPSVPAPPRKPSIDVSRPLLPTPAPAPLPRPPVASACRVLVCAPSNAAVDEIVLRLVTHGVWNSLGGKMVPRVVRLGISTSPNPAVMAVTVDAKVEQFLSIKRVGSGQPNYAKITDLLARKEAMSAKILDAQVKLTSRQQAGTLMPSEQRSLEAEIDRLRVRREGIVSELFALQAQQRSVRKLRRISLTL